jgi:Predicted transcription regulator containing HTH domain
MAAKTAARKMPDTYFALVREFPLTHIRNRNHLADALKVIDQLLQRELDRGAQEYLDVLSDLVARYEDEHEPIPDASEADVLRELIRSSGCSQTMLARKIGIAQSTLSAVLNEDRALTRDHIVTLAKFFNVSPEVFLQS